MNIHFLPFSLKIGIQIGLFANIFYSIFPKKSVNISGAPSRIRTCAPGSGDRRSIP